MDEVVIEQLSPERFSHFWPLIQKELEKIPHIWEDYWTVDSIFEASLCGTLQCWAIGGEDGAATMVVWTRISHFPSNRILQVCLAFGSCPDSYIATLDATLEDFAKHVGCQIIEVLGRLGWNKKLKGRYEKVTTTVSRRIADWKVQ